MGEHTIPGGPSKGTALSEADDKSIKYWLDRREKELAGEPDGRFAADNQAWIDAAKAELHRRAGGGEQRQTARTPSGPTTALQKAKPTEMQLGASMNDPTAVTAKLTELAASYHLVSPASSVDGMPPGCGVQLSFVSVNPDEKIGEVYAVGGGKLGLSAVTLSKIGAAAGISWDPDKSGRLDDGSHPHYCHYRAVGKTRNFDGTVRVLTGEVEIDARDGSPQIDEIQQKAAAREADRTYTGKRDGGASQILELRKFLLRHAERKAKSRAIADLGVKRSYTKAELAKPFAVANLMFTGQTDDPELKRAFAHKIADSFLGASAALFGSTQAQQPRRELVARSAPPPLLVDGEGYEPLDEGELAEAGA
jgi:hypothetical protein